MLARWVPRLVSHACVGALLCAACDAPRPRVRDDLDASDDASTAARFARPTLDPLNRQRRARCAFEQGAVPSETLDPTDPRGDSIPIDHFIVIMQENRSFDEYFEMLPERGVPDADVAPKHFSNPDPHARGAAVSIFHQTQYCEDDVEHDADSDLTQYAGGKQTGFVASADGDMGVMGYYDESDLPYYYALARTFSIGDRYFSALLGPTWPNRMFAQSASSFGQTGNVAPAGDPSARTIYRELQDAGRSWTIYAEGSTIEAGWYSGLHDLPGDHFGDMKRFAADAASGNLPNFAWIESRLTKTGGDDEHPPADVQVGERFVATAIAAVMASPNWSRSAIFLIYDEHGGFFDHVAPPSACAPDPGANEAAFQRYGMRVPFVVASPYAWPNHVSHVVLSHSSILRLVEARFDLPALSGRDANDTPPYDLFDFEQPAFITPPPLPAAVVDPTELARCKKHYM